MAMRVSGINSGLDTDAIVQELVSAYSKKTEKYEKEQTKLSWKQDIWKSLNSKVYGLYTKISNMRFSSAYAIKTVNSSDTTKATVSASGNAVNGTHKLNVLQTAQSAYMTGRKITTANGGAIDPEKTKLSELELGVTQDAYLRVKTIDSEGNEVLKDLKFTKDSTINDVVNGLQNAGLTASFDAKQGRFYISSKSSGANSDFDIIAANTISVPKVDENQNIIKDENGDVEYEVVKASDAQIAGSNYLLNVLGLKNDSLVAGEAIKVGRAQNKATLNDKMTSIVGLIPADTSLENFKTSFKVYKNGKEVSAEIDTGKLDEDNKPITEKKDSVTIDAGTSIGDVLEQFRQLGISAGFDSNTGTFVFHEADEILFKPTSEEGSNSAIRGLGLSNINTDNLYSSNTVKTVTADVGTKLADLGLDTGISFKINGIKNTFTKEQSIGEVVGKLKDAGVDVKFANGGFVFKGRVAFQATDNSEAGQKAFGEALKKLGLSTYAGTTVKTAGAVAEENTKLSDLGFDIDISFKVNGKEYSFAKDQSIEDVVKQFQANGINVKFASGKFEFEDTVSFEAVGDSDEKKSASAEALSKLGLGTAGSDNTVKTVGSVAGKDTKLSDLGFAAGISFKIDGIEKPFTFTAEQNIEEVVGSLQAAYVNVEFANGKFVFENGVIFKAAADSEAGKKAFEETIQKLGLSTYSSNIVADEETTLADLGFSDTISFKVNGKGYQFTTGQSIGDVVKKFNDIGIAAKFDDGKFVFGESKDGKLDVRFAVAGDSAEEKNASEEALRKLGLFTNFKKREESIRIEGKDSEIELDGVTYTNSTNDFSINGLNITAQGVTGAGDDKAIIINTNTDSQGLYDTVKNFLTEYNAIINEITKLYNADSARDYEPLTDEEKDAMSDTEVAKWETKIKDSLLRRDNSLNAIMSAMINSMNTGIQVNGKTYTLTSFGIHTLGFLNAVDNEQYAFHIDGDAEDENTSGEDDELMKAIQEDPDTVVEFMKQLSTNLYNAIDKQMQGNSLRTRYKIYNDKEMDIQYKNYSKTIKEWEDKVSAKEDYYYKKFSQMETALAKLNSQQSSLAGLLGN